MLWGSHSPLPSPALPLLICVCARVSVCVLTAIEVEAATLEAINTGPVHQVEAIQGSRAELPCDVAPVEPDDRFVLVLWYKDGIGTPIYSHDSRGNSQAAARDWADLEALGGRVHFDLDAAPSALVVEHLRPEDKGLYRCRVDFKKSPTRNARSNLTVIIPSDTPSVSLESGQQVWTMVGPYDEGDRLALTCRVAGGDPSPAVKWRLGNKILDHQFESPEAGVVINKLVIESLGRQHLHAALLCEAVNTNYSAPVTTMVTIEMNLRPLSVQILGGREPLSAGRPYELVCHSAGARPPAIISWWLGGAQLSNATTSTASSGNVTVSSLLYEPRVADSGKRLRCRAESPVIPHPPLQDTYDIDVFYTPEVILALGSSLSPDQIKEGEDVYFECNVKAKPKIYKVIWYHNGELVKHNVSAGVIVSNQSLVLQRVRRLQTGLYTCIASNSEGDGESNALNLSVQYSPVCVPGQVITYSAARHEEVTVTCQIDAVPPMVTFNWRFNSSGDVVDIAESHIASQGLKSSLSYVARTELDYGTLQCWGTNPLGRQKEPCKFRVIPAERPDPPKSCNLLNDSTDSLTVKCSAGYNGGLPQMFVAEVYDVETEHLLLNITDAATPYFQLVGLEAGTSFVVNVYATNSKGPSKKRVLDGYTDRDFTERRIAQVRHPPMAKMSKEIPYAQFLGIGLGVLGSLVLFIVVAVLFLRWKKETTRPKMHKNSLQTSLSDSREENPDVIPSSEAESETNLPCAPEGGGFHSAPIPPPAAYSASLYTTLPRAHQAHDKMSISHHEHPPALMYEEMLPPQLPFQRGCPMSGSLPRRNRMPSISGQLGCMEQHQGQTSSLTASQSMMMQNHPQHRGRNYAATSGNFLPSHPTVVSTAASPLGSTNMYQMSKHQGHSQSIPCSHSMQQDHFLQAGFTTTSPNMGLPNQHLLNSKTHCNPNRGHTIRGESHLIPCPRQYSPEQWSQPAQYDNMPSDSLNTLSYAHAHSIPLSSTVDPQGDTVLSVSSVTMDDSHGHDTNKSESESSLMNVSSRSTETLLKNKQKESKV